MKKHPVRPPFIIMGDVSQQQQQQRDDDHARAQQRTTKQKSNCSHHQDTTTTTTTTKKKKKGVGNKLPWIWLGTVADEHENERQDDEQNEQRDDGRQRVRKQHFMCALSRVCFRLLCSLSCSNKVNQIYKTKSVFKKPLKSLTTKNNCCLRGFTSTSRSIFNPEGSA